MIRKYSRIADQEALEEIYQHYAVKIMPRVPYPKGIQMVLAEGQEPRPGKFIDSSYVKELEQAGFIKKLYGE